MYIQILSKGHAHRNCKRLVYFLRLAQGELRVLDSAAELFSSKHSFITLVDSGITI